MIASLLAPRLLIREIGLKQNPGAKLQIQTSWAKFFSYTSARAVVKPMKLPWIHTDVTEQNLTSDLYNGSIPRLQTLTYSGAQYSDPNLNVPGFRGVQIWPITQPANSEPNQDPDLRFGFIPHSTSNE